MSLHAIAVLVVLFGCFIAAFLRHPFWGVIGYVFLYFNIPNPEINWWASQLPNLRWSLLAAIVVLVSLFLHRDKLNQIKILEPLNYRILLALCMLMLIISPAAVCPEQSYERLYDFFRYVICFVFFVKCIPNMSKFEILVWICLLCCLNLSWEGYIHPEYRHAGRLEGIGTPDSTDSNMFATVLLMPVPFLINEVLFAKTYRKVGALLVAVFVLNGIVLTGSRGALIGLVAIGMTFLFFEQDHKVRKKIFLGVVCAALLFIKLLDTTFIERLVSVEEGLDSTGSGRTEIWAYGLRMAADYPLGAGGNGFVYLSPSYLPKRLLSFGSRRSPHNTYLKVLVEQGVLGLVFFLLFWGITIKMLHSLRKKIIQSAPGQGSELFLIKQYALATEAAIIGILLSSFFVDRLYFELLYWLAAMATFLSFYGKRLIALQEGSTG